MPSTRSREEFEKDQSGILAPYAAHSQHSLGREHAEHEHDWRPAFQRDLARIIHSKAFRRLEYKTQVFVNHEGDHYRTRLTHSLEVAQIARTASRILRLNEELSETISLAHDLGHTPFGHSGEHVMNELMKGHGGFEHNRQSLRVVTHLERVYPQFAGLNLTYEVRDGISKHFSEYDQQGLKTSGHHTLEAELVNLADEIAYNNHDLDDGLRSGMISFEDLAQIEIWQVPYEKNKKEFAKSSPEIIRSQTVRGIINQLVMDLVENTTANLEKNKIRSREDFLKSERAFVDFSPEIKKKNTALKRFLYQNLYQHYRVIRMAEKAQRVIRDLFETYLQNIRILPPNVQSACEIEGTERAICDYIAGMTDRFAMEEHRKLMDPAERV